VYTPQRNTHTHTCPLYRPKIYIYIYIYLYIYISAPLIQGGPPGHAGSEEANWDNTVPVKDSNTRIKPLALASGHGRYITVTTERTLVSVGEWPLHIAYSRYNFLAASLPKRFRNGRFTSETAVRRFQKLNRHLDPEALLKIRWGF
jgi:hypothetical protein